MQILESETLNKEIGKLLCKIKSGDNDAFCSFVDLTKKQLALSALAYLKSAGDIEDALQDTYIAVLTHIDSYVSNENPMGWVYRIFKNKCLSILRSRRGDLPLDFAVDIGAAFSFEDTDSMMLVRVLMETLSKKEKTVVSMRLWLDMTFKEIASAAHLSKAAAFRIYKRAIKKLEEKCSSQSSLCAATKTLNYGGEKP